MNLNTKEYIQSLKCPNCSMSSKMVEHASISGDGNYTISLRCRACEYSCTVRLIPDMSQANVYEKVEKEMKLWNQA